MGFSFNALTGQFDLVGSGSSNPNFANPVADESSLPSGADGMLVVVRSTDHVYVYDGTTSKWVDTGLTSVAFGSSPNTQGYTLNKDTSGAIVRNTLTIQPADASHPGAVSTGAQSFAGDKTFSNNVNVTGNITATAATYANGGLDVSTLGGTLSIGSTNASVINIGTASSTVNIVGSVNNNQVTNLNVTDALITLNDGGGAGSAAGAGFELEEAGSATGYVKTSGDRNSFVLKAPNTAGIATVTPGSGGITLNQSSHDPISITSVGSSPNASGLSLSNQQITLQPADGTNPGLVTADAQTLGGEKTFTSLITSTAGMFVTGSEINLDVGDGTQTITIDPGSNISISDTNSGDSAQVSPGYVSVSNGATPSLIELTDGQIKITRGGNPTTPFLDEEVTTKKYVDLGLATKQPTGNYITGLTGDVMASGPGAVSSTVNSVGGSSASNIHSAELAANAATTSNTSGTIVKRDASGNFSAGTITATLNGIANNVSGVVAIANGGTNSSAALTNGKVMVSTGGAIVESTVTATELGYVSGVTSGIQAQLDSKSVKSTGDIAETSFTAADNQVSAANITGFSFANATVRSFEAQVSIVRGSTFAVYRLMGIQKASNWELSEDFVGDTCGISFSITSLGQIQYVSSSTGSSATIKFRASTLTV